MGWGLMKEYLSTLNTRNKWNEEKGNIAPGDVVLMVDRGNSRGHWPVSQIQEVLPGPDGKVKVVRVRQAKIMWPITKLCPLEV